MRKPVAAEIMARAIPPRDSRSDAPTELVCLALTLALVTLAARIASFW
jgi:hypothetical protein